ncbi:MAG: 3-deoxy-D-manno-octulosonic acid transferase [Vicinamibacterales bacterium]
MPTLIAILETPLEKPTETNLKLYQQQRSAALERVRHAEYHPGVHLFYTVAVVVLAAVLSPWFLYEAIAYRKYIGSLAQRMGHLPISFNLDHDESIWIHAVSVGEALTARALIDELRSRYPHLKLFLSTTTLTGQQVARTRLQGLDAVFFFPFDLPLFVNRTLRLVRPRLFIMMETEIWPNLLRACRRRGVRTLLVNGRISSRSYPRYRLARPFFRRVLADIDRFCMQSDESARRVIHIGADPSRVMVTGSLKFDSLESPALSAGRGASRVLRYFRIPASRLVFIAASTLRGEEAPVLAAFAALRRSHPNALLIMAPRKPDRFDEAETLSRAEGFRVLRRMELAVDAEPRADVVILDSMGELAHLFQVATLVFVGGSLVAQGGHNILEPAVHGKPIVFGPHMHNFAEIAETFVREQAAIQVDNAAELTTVVQRLAGDGVERARLGAAARALVEANRGAKTRTLDVIAKLLPQPGRRGVVRPFRRG